MLPVTRLPQTFTELCKIELHHERKDLDLVIKTVESDEALKNVVINSIPEFSDQASVNKLVGLLGWRHFRDRVAGLYLDKKVTGIYPRESGLDRVIEIQDFENRFSPYSIHGSSRIFLLAFYLKMSSIDAKGEQKAHAIRFLHAPLELSKILEAQRSRHRYSDLLILLCWNLLNFISYTDLNALARKGKLNYQTAFELLAKGQRASFFQNIFAYCASTGQKEIFSEILT